MHSRIFQLIEDHSGKLSSTRLKSFMAFFLVAFMVIYGVLARIPMDLSFIGVLLSYGFIETGSEKIKDAAISKYAYGDSETNSD